MHICAITNLLPESYGVAGKTEDMTGSIENGESSDSLTVIDRSEERCQAPPGKHPGIMNDAHTPSCTHSTGKKQMAVYVVMFARS